MTIDAPVIRADLAEAVATPLADTARWQIFLYLGVLLVLLGFGSPGGGLIGLPISFFLKNKLHLKAHELATFQLISHIPVYFSFAFGFARDRFNPFGMRDRGFMVLFGGIAAGLYLFFAFTHPTYATLMVAVLLLYVSVLFLYSAQRGLTATIGQQHVMSGQVSAAWNIFEALPGIAALLAGGVLSDLMEGRGADQAARLLFLVGALIAAAIGLFGFMRPKSVFGHLHSERLTSAHPWEDFRRLLKHWPIYPALFIWLLWNFAPGSVTSLQFYLQNTLHAKDAQWGQWNAIFAASFIPTFLVFGALCRRFPLKTLLLWGTVVAVPQFVPLLFVHSVTGALIAAAPIGLMGGVATAAYLDLIIRSAPKGLQGTVLMATVGFTSIDARFGDVLGTNLYDHFGGFTVCVIAITIVYALILPTLLLVPKRLIATADGAAPPEA
jgi:Na+/melibiose symporter-like transporter